VLQTLAAVSPQWQRLAVAILVAVGGAYIVADIAARLTRLLLRRACQGESPARFTGPIVRTPIRATRAVVFCAGLILAVRPVLSVSGAALPDNVVNAPWVQWLLSSGPKILIVALVAYVLVRAAILATARWETRLGLSDTLDDVERVKRARTIGALARNVVITAVCSTAALTILRDLGVDVMPVLTGAGILGLAVGFGAQTLVRDVISGFFLIFENHLRVGDVAVIEGTGGIVESINLRTTTIRDLEGTVHVFPNGAFERFSNRTKDYSYYVIDVGVAYKEDTDRVSGVLRAVGAELREDPGLASAILAPLEVLGVDAFEDSQVTIKTRIKTVPLKQWDVGRELRRRIKLAFDREGIEIPFPHISLYIGEASRPLRVDGMNGRSADTTHAERREQ
jgi:moderate conductance mechanosensitive channel